MHLPKRKCILTSEICQKLVALPDDQLVVQIRILLAAQTTMYKILFTFVNFVEILCLMKRLTWFFGMNC